jgi:hypothetical protein
VPAPLIRPSVGPRHRCPQIALALALTACGCLLGATPARASTRAALQVSFAPNRPGASTVLRLALRFSGGSEGVPTPLRTVVLHMPAGLAIQLRGTRTCAPARLRHLGAAGCPTAALLGRGHARLEVHAGSQTIPEQALLWAFRGPSTAAGAATLAILGVGSTPLAERTISAGVLGGDRAPFGSKLTITVPPIPTVVFEPDASFDSLSLTVGTVANRSTGHAPGARIVVPRRCPPGGFPFAATIGFADGSTASANTAAVCP